MLTLIMWIIDLGKTKIRPGSHIYHDITTLRPKYHDIEIPRPKNCDIEIWGPKHHNIKKWRQRTQDIMILRHFFTGRKAETSRFQNQKVTTLSFCGILTLMPHDKHWWYSRTLTEHRNTDKSPEH